MLGSVRLRAELDGLVFEPETVNLLQECFDDIVRKHNVDRKSEAAEKIAKALFYAYRAGAREKDLLILLADVRSGV